MIKNKQNIIIWILSIVLLGSFERVGATPNEHFFVKGGSLIKKVLFDWNVPPVKDTLVDSIVTITKIKKDSHTVTYKSKIKFDSSMYGMRIGSHQITLEKRKTKEVLKNIRAQKNHWRKKMNSYIKGDKAEELSKWFDGKLKVVNYEYQRTLDLNTEDTLLIHPITEKTLMPVRTGFNPSDSAIFKMIRAGDSPIALSAYKSKKQHLIRLLGDTVKLINVTWNYNNHLFTNQLFVSPVINRIIYNDIFYNTIIFYKFGRNVLSPTPSYDSITEPLSPIPHLAKWEVVKDKNIFNNLEILSTKMKSLNWKEQLEILKDKKYARVFNRLGLKLKSYSVGKLIDPNFRDSL